MKTYIEYTLGGKECRQDFDFVPVGTYSAMGMNGTLKGGLYKLTLTDHGKALIPLTETATGKQARVTFPGSYGKIWNGAKWVLNG